MNAMIVKWFPSNEKSTVVAIATTGNQLGPILVYPLGSLFCPLRSIMDGWPLMFYAGGVQACTRAHLWHYLHRIVRHRLVCVVVCVRDKFTVKTHAYQ
jgi:sugar phosphate permease